MVFSKTLHIFQQKTFTLIIGLTWLFYILIAFGLSSTAPIYLNDLQYYTKIYVSLFLLIRFNPFRKIEFTDLDRRIAFASGVFLLGTTAINSLLVNYLSSVKNSLIN
jgi:hypothetical protein